MEVATLVADGAVSWISVTVEILDCPTHMHTHKHIHTPYPFKFVHQIYSTIETEGSNWEVFICLGPQAPRVHIFLPFFLSSPCLSLFRLPVCGASNALLSPLFFFLASCFQDSHKPLGGSSGRWSCRLTNMVTC